MENASVATQHQAASISANYPSSSSNNPSSISQRASNPFSSRFPHWDICQHKFLICCSLSHSKCCACLDDRQHSQFYPRYVDGVGEVNDAPRWDRYCSSCKVYWKSFVERCNINPQQTQVPNYPNPLPGGHNPTSEAFRLPPSPPSQSQVPRQLPYPHPASQESHRQHSMQHEPLHRALAPTPEWASEYTRMRNLPSAFQVFSQMGFRLSSPPPPSLQIALQNWELADGENLRAQPDGVSNMSIQSPAQAAAREAVLRELRANNIDVYLLLRPDVPTSYSMSEAFRNFSSWAAGTPIVERDTSHAMRAQSNYGPSGMSSGQQRPESWAHRGTPSARGSDAETSMIARDRQREHRERFESEMGRGSRSLRINHRGSTESRGPISPVSFAGLPQFTTFGWSPPNTGGLVASSNVSGQARGFESGQDLSQPVSIVSTGGSEQQQAGSRHNRSFSTPSNIANWAGQSAGQGSSAAQAQSPTSSTASSETAANSPMQGVESGTTSTQSPPSQAQPPQLQRSQSDQTQAAQQQPQPSQQQRGQPGATQEPQQPQQPQQPPPQQPPHHNHHQRRTSQGTGGAGMVAGVLGSREDVEREDYESPIGAMFANHWREYNIAEQRRRNYREMEERQRRTLRQQQEERLRRGFPAYRPTQPRFSAGTRATTNASVQAEQRRSYPSLAIHNLARSLGQTLEDDLHSPQISPPLDPPSWEDDMSIDEHDTMSFLAAVGSEAARRREEGRSPTENGSGSQPALAPATAESAEIQAAHALQARRQVEALEQLMGWSSDSNLRRRHVPPIVSAPRLRPAQVYHSVSGSSSANSASAAATGGAAASAAAAAVAGTRARSTTLGQLTEEARRLHSRVEQQRQQRETAEFLRNEELRRITDFASLLHSGVNIRRQAQARQMARTPMPARTLDDPERPENMKEEDMKIMSDCKVCFGQIADMVLLPCAHLVLCQWCADAVAPAHPARPDLVTPRSQCPVCRAKVEKKVKVFRA